MSRLVEPIMDREDPLETATKWESRLTGAALAAPALRLL
jgi:hypothetical protein